MNIKTLAILVVLAAAAVGGVLFTSQERPEGQVVTQQHLLPGLSDDLNSVERLRLVRAGEELVAELARGDSGWVVANRDNYPADLGKVRETLLALADSRLVEEKTSNPEFYERLGVGDVNDAEAVGTRLELTGVGEEPVALIIGDPARNVEGTYARRVGEERSWLVSGVLDLSQAIADWLDTAVIDIPAAQIQSLTIQHPDGETLTLEKADRSAMDFSLAEIPEGRELESQGSANALGGVLAGLQLEDVMSAGSLEDAGEVVTLRYQSFDGLVVEAEAFQQDERRLLRFTGVSYDEAQARRFLEVPEEDEAVADEEVAADSSETEASPEPATLDQETIAAGVDRAEELANRLEGWIFEIPSYKHDNMIMRLADLLAPVEEQPAEESDELVPVLPEQG